MPSGNHGQFSLPLTVTLRRVSDAFLEDDFLTSFVQEAKKEEIEIFQIADKEGRFAPADTLRLSFNTLGKVDNYWLETGLFI